MIHTCEYDDLLDRFGNFQYIGDARQDKFADALIVNLFAQGSAIYPIYECGATSFLHTMCDEAGIRIKEVESRHIYFETMLKKLPDAEGGRYPDISFISATSDYLLSFPHIRNTITSAQDNASKARKELRLSVGVLATMAVGILTIGVVRDFGWGFWALTGGAAGTGALTINYNSGCDRDYSFAALKRNAGNLILQEWMRTAIDYGKWTIALESKAYGASKVHRADMEEYSISAERIEDVKTASRLRIQNLINKTTGTLMPQIYRGFIIEVRSHHPALAGTSLKFAAHSTDTFNQIDGDDDNDRRKNPKKQQTTWSWLPQAPVPVPT